MNEKQTRTRINIKNICDPAYSVVKQKQDYDKLNDKINLVTKSMIQNKGQLKTIQHIEKSYRNKFGKVIKTDS